MLRRSRKATVVDPDLGELTRSRGWWRGSVRLDPHGMVPLAVPGSRAGPDPDAVALARSIQLELDRCRVPLREALDEHRTAYEDAEPAAPGDARPTYASVMVLDGHLTIEIGLDVHWDEEHTLGAHLRGGRLIELSGSVLEP